MLVHVCACSSERLIKRRKVCRAVRARFPMRKQVSQSSVLGRSRIVPCSSRKVKKPRALCLAQMEVSQQVQCCKVCVLQKPRRPSGRWTSRMQTAGVSSLCMPDCKMGRSTMLSRDTAPSMKSCTSESAVEMALFCVVSV